MSSFTIGEVCVCVCLWWRIECLKRLAIESLLCVLMQRSSVLPHLCAKEHFSVCLCVCVCVRPRCQTAAIFASQTGREAAEARQTFEVLFSPRSSIHPEEICHVVLPFWFPYGGVEWKGICPYLLSASQYTQTLVKVTKKLVFRLAAFFPLLLLV